MSDGSPWRAIALVGIVAAISAALVSASWEFGRFRIAANERARLLASLSSVLDERHIGENVNPVLLTVEDPALLGSEGEVEVFVPMRGQEPLAAVFATVAPEGYNGPISLLIGVDMKTATVTGVRTVSHRETPGLGDLIEVQKSPWILQFDGTSLNAPDESGWRVRQEGGAFDALTGATVTPRAVIKAVRNTLLYFETNKQALIARAREALNRPPEDTVG